MKKPFLLFSLSVLFAGMPAYAADYNMESGTGHTVTVDDTFYFYDDGGPSGPITTGFSGQVTFVPTGDKAVRIDTEEFAVSANKMFVYNGREKDDTKILGSDKGYFVGTGPKDLVSEAEDGSMTIFFGSSKGAGATGKNLKGWKIKVSLADKPKKQDEPMTGTYRVGPSSEARFRNLTELQTALAAGIGAPVTIELEDNVYAENLLLKDIAGLSATNTLTITSVTGKPDACVINGTITPVDKTGTVCLDGTPYVTLTNITIAANEGNGSQTPYAALHLRNGSDNVTVDHCVITAPLASANDNRTYLLLGVDADNLTVKSNRFEGGYIGLYTGTDPESDVATVTGGLSVTDNAFGSIAYRSAQIVGCNAFDFSVNNITPGIAGKKSANHLEVRRPSGAFTILRNKLLAEQATDCTGIYLRDGGGSADAEHPALIANNVIAMPKAANQYTWGMCVDVTMTNLVVAHNTINIKSTATNVYGIALNGNAAAKDVAAKIVNNIITLPGKGAALRPWNASHYANVNFAGNVYFAADGLVDCDKNTIEAYRTATGDQTSVWLSPEYMSDSDLRLKTSDRSMYMPLMPGVAADYDGMERTDPTCAGAYEYTIPAPDAPVISEGYPHAPVVSEKKVEVTTCWSIGGQLYAKTVAAGAETPTAEELKATEPVAIDGGKEAVSVFTGLQPSTAYKAYFLVVSALGAESAVVCSEVFTTPEVIQPLEALIFWQDEPFNAGETVELQAYVEGGKEPYTYSWVDQGGNEVSQSESYSYTADRSLSFHLYVTSADGQSVVCKDDIAVVNAELAIATFDDLALKPETSWRWDTEISDGGMYQDTFFSGSFAFGNTSMPSYNFWGGYGYSNETETSFSTLDHQMRNCVGGGACGTANYGVCYGYGADTRIMLNVGDEGVIVPGIYVTNSAYTLNSILNGDGFAQKFESGDWQEVTFEGLLNGESGESVTVALADYRGDTPEVLNTWKWVDLSPLGKVNGLKISFAGSQVTKIPTYVCIDEIGAFDTSAISNIVSDTDDVTRYYDLQGLEVTQPQRGHLYIVVYNGKAYKQIF